MPIALDPARRTRWSAPKGLTTRLTAILALSCAAATSSYALTCDELKSEIDQKIRTSGVANFSLTIVDVAATADGRVVGSCDNGSRKILYAPAATTQVRPAAATPAVLTECKAGFTGPDCRQRIADQ